MLEKLNDRTNDIHKQLKELEELKDTTTEIRNQLKELTESQNKLSKQLEVHINCSSSDDSVASRSELNQVQSPRYRLEFTCKVKDEIEKDQIIETDTVGKMISVALYDDHDQIVETGPLASAKVKLVVVNGEFNQHDTQCNWSREEFERNIKRPRQGSSAVGDVNRSTESIVKNCYFYLIGGVKSHGDATILYNSSNKRVKLGVMVVSPMEERVLEGLSNPFFVRGHDRPARESKLRHDRSKRQRQTLVSFGCDEGLMQNPSWSHLNQPPEIILPQVPGNTTVFSSTEPSSSVEHQSSHPAMYGISMAQLPYSLQAISTSEQSALLSEPMDSNSAPDHYSTGNDCFPIANGTQFIMDHIACPVQLVFDRPIAEPRKSWNLLDQLMPLYWQPKFHNCCLTTMDLMLGSLMFIPKDVMQTRRRGGVLIEPLEPDDSDKKKLERRLHSKYRLRFVNKVCKNYYTREQIKADDGNPLKVALFDENHTKITSGPLSSASVEVVVLHGDFNADGQDYWTSEDFSSCLVCPRPGNSEAVLGDNCILILAGGEACLSDDTFFKVSSFHARTGKFTMGARLASAQVERVQEGISEPFPVRDCGWQGSMLWPKKKGEKTLDADSCDSGCGCVLDSSFLGVALAARHSTHTMNPELLRASATGDKALLERVLGLTSTSSGNGVAPPEAAQKQGGGSLSCLKGVTSEGNTALHTAAGRGYLELVRTICDLDASLVGARNNLLDTPLICAARAGHAGVVACLMEHDAAAAAAREGACAGEEPMLRARNSEGATAMHEAIRNGHDAVLRMLMSADDGLAAVVDAKGFSPLYLAVALGRADMVAVLIGGSPAGVKSPAYYAGPDGQTALHAAVLVSEEMSKSLCRWEPILAKKVDNFGNTALHHAASAGKVGEVKLLLREDSSLAYIPDVDGLFPVHTAAKMGKIAVIDLLMETCPNCDELLDNRGRNVLHCAIAHRKEKVVQHMCRNPRFGRMMNARDRGGNTPLHLAVEHGCYRIVTLLLQNARVNLSIMNNDGATPLDVAINAMDHGYTYQMNPAILIAQCLVWCGAHQSPRRWDEYLNKRSNGDSEKELSKYINLTQNREIIGSVLIATVTFAAAFTLPDSAGAAAAAKWPAFEAFIVSNTMAFLSSTVATCLLLYEGHATFLHAKIRSRFHVWSFNLLHVSVRLLIASFSFGVHLTLSPPGTGAAAVPAGMLNLAVCAMACVAVVFTQPGTWWPMVITRPIWARLGPKGLLAVLLGPRPIPCQKLLISRTPWLNIFKMLATLFILALILFTFLCDMSYPRLAADHSFSNSSFSLKS
ncbi:hypothetical protein ACP4OV_002306 [Aristida adscensionis]